MAVQLTKEQLPAFKGVVEIFDTDGNGTIECSELQHMMNAMGHMELDAAEVQKALKEADADGNKVLDFSEFVKILGIVLKGRLSNKDDWGVFQGLFFIMGKESDSMMSFNEMRQLMNVLGENMTEDEIRAMMGGKDDVSRDDFQEIMENKYRK